MLHYRVITSLCALVLLGCFATTGPVEDQIKGFAARKYPGDYWMQQYAYDKQLSAYKFMQTVKDTDLKRSIETKYPNDYQMQKYVYDRQLAAEEYMETVDDPEIKATAVQRYPLDYQRQKFIYDWQLTAKQEMGRR